MNLTNKILFAAIVFAFALSVSGSAKTPYEKITGLKGIVRDSGTHEPVEFVTVALADTSGTVIAGATTDSTGRYSMTSSGTTPDCRLLFSLIGYKERIVALSGCLDGNVTDGIAEIPPVLMEPDLQMLAAAKVSGERPLIEYRFDRLVMNVSELAVAQTGDALDVLKSSPGVTVDKDGNVKLNGSTVAVWIDGRPSNMSGADLQTYLQGSEGSAIETVELITNPSARYDAEGSGGIINIKTKKSFMKGFSGTMRASGGAVFSPYAYFYGNVSANLRYKTDRTNTFFQYTPSVYNSAFVLDEIKLYGEGNSMRQESHALTRNMSQSHHIRFGNDWNISDKDILGVIVRLNWNGSSSGYISPNIVRDYMDAGIPSESLYSEFAGENNSSDKNADYSVNLNYTRTFDESLNQELTLNADYYRTENNVTRSIRNIYSFLSPESSSAGLKDNGFDDGTDRKLDLYSFKADYSQSLFEQTGRLEAGLKAAYSGTDNRYGMYDYDFAAQSLLLDERNDFTYGEQVYAAYVNLSKKFGEKWNAQTGVRGEYTVQEGNWMLDTETNRRSFKDYFDLFPSVFLSYAPSQKAILSASYSYRISRPKYWQLNPFRDYGSATSYTQGNIELEPSYSHNVQLTGVFFSRLSVSGGFNMTNNFSDVQTPILDKETGVMGLLYSNAGDQYIAYASLSLSELPITKWWNITANLSYLHLSFSAYDDLAELVYGGPYSNSSDAFQGYASTTFLLPKNFKFGIDGWMSTPASLGYFNILAMGGLNFSLIKTFDDGKYTLALYANDVLNTGDTNGYMENDGVRTYILKQDYTNTNVSLSFTWRFGNNSSHGRQRNVGNLDEASRL